MFELEGADHYQTVVERLADEFEEEIRDEPRVIDDIARGVVAAATLVGEQPVVQHSAVVWGERIAATDGEALGPYQIIQSSAMSTPQQSQDDSTEALAVACLTRDIASHFPEIYSQSNADSDSAEVP
jgi:hypothetical protein